MSEVRILIADDHELVRRGLVRVIKEKRPEWKIVAEVSNGAEAIEQGKELQPDIAILDLSMPDCNGLYAAQRLREEAPGIRTLILTMHGAAPILRHLKRAGVNAYLTKNEAPEMLVPSIERILAGEPFFASQSASRPAEDLELEEYIPVQFLLTPREVEVMRLLALGKSNKELAFELDMSVRTVETHRASVLEKLGVESVADIVRLAIRDSII